MPAGVPLELLEKHPHTVKNYGKRQKHSNPTNIKMR